MALADTELAIGKVSDLLIEHLSAETNLSIKVGRPEPAPGTDGERLNLFLYEALFDPSLKNLPFDEGQPAPLWLVLKYLMTAFDEAGDSDSVKAHENLGKGIRALQKLSYLPLHTTIDALKDNPEILKITFDEASSELLSKLMQGSDEKYRFSISFQVRPVMIATDELPSYSLLVGVDYTESPIEVIGEAGVQIPVIPSMGPKITHISPSKFEVNSTLTILGSDLDLSGLSVCLGPAELAVTAQQPDKLECLVDETIENGSVISAGSHPISVVQTLLTGRRRSSNLLIGDLLPTLTDAVPNSLQHDDLADPDSDVFGNIDMTGVLLGTEEDDIFVALYRDGSTVKVFDEFTTDPSQNTLTLAIKQEDAVPPGKYRVILRVNGQQSKNSPEVELIVP
ncbi:MAG: Pvc16 family protein [Candidatus Bipolaricaulia bacterium]